MNQEELIKKYVRLMARAARLTLLKTARSTGAHGKEWRKLTQCHPIHVYIKSNK